MPKQFKRDKKFAFKPIHILLAKYVLIYILAWYLFMLMGVATSLNSVVAQDGQVEAKIKKTKPVEINLPNGLKVIIWEDHSFPVVSSMVWYKVGSKNEKSGTTGLSHLVEHLLFKDVGSLRQRVGAAVARVGGKFNGYTSDDFTTFFETLPSSKLELALLIESQRMRHANFSQEDLQEEIINIEREFESDSRDPNSLFTNEVKLALYQQHPYRNPVRGWRNDVENLSLADVKAFYDTYYWPNNATLVIVGDVDLNNTSNLVNKYFAGLAKSSSAITTAKSSEPIQHGERRLVLKYPGRQEMLSLAYRAPAANENDVAAMVVLEKYLNVAYTGKLKTKLIDGKICSSAHAGFEIKKDPGIFKIDCIAVPATYNAEQKITEGLESIINSLKSQSLSDSEIKRARKQAQNAYLQDKDGPYKAAFCLGYFDTLSTWQMDQTWSDRLGNVSAADIQRVAKKYFNPDSRVIGWLHGQAAPAASAPTPDTHKEHTGPSKDHSPGKQFDHAHLTGYKESDEQIVPTASAPTSDGNVEDVIKSEFLQGHLLGPKISKRILKNGLTVLVFESHLSPIVQIEGAIKAGDICDPPNKKGLSDLIVTLLNQGKNGKQQNAIVQEDLGLTPAQMLSFENNIETIGFRTSSLNSDLSSMLNLISQAVTSSSWSDESIDKAKKETISSIKHDEENINERINRALLQAFVAEKTSFYPIDPMEKTRTIEAMTTADVQSFASANVQPASTTIVFSGDIEPGLAYALAEKYFGSWTNKANANRPVLSLSNRRVRKIVIPLKDKTKGTVCFGQVIPISKSQEDFSSFLIADNVLDNNPIISRVTALVPSAKPELDRNFEVKLQALSDYTYWMISSSADIASLPKIANSLGDALNQIGKNGVSENEFVEAKKYLLGAIPVRRMSSLSSVSKHVLEFITHGDDSLHYSMFLASIQNTSLDSVNKVIKSLFKPDQSTQIVVGNSQIVKAFRGHNQRRTQ